ncbi:MAG: hypothetical protein A4E19_03290 [Nitrospira sp. SG-bin1]|nr:MAG: hypothetical protein A4E19_03290 [Nitrospira sp. SG-bin1]
MEERTASIILATLSLVLLGSASAPARNIGDLHEAMEAQPAQSLLPAQVATKDHQNEHQLLQGNRTVLGKVEAVTSDQIKVDIGEVQPRFLPLKQAQQKNFPAIKPGDDLVIVVNEQNLIVDYHPLEYPSGHHKVLRGAIASNMPIGHDRVVIKGADGKEQSFNVRSQVRSKLASIPVGTPAIFLIDETNHVADATFASVSAAKEAHRNPEDKSPIKGANRQVDGTVGEPLRADRITLKTGDGERSFEVRDVMIERTSKLRSGDSVILMVDNENKVVDMAMPPQESR